MLQPKALTNIRSFPDAELITISQIPSPSWFCAFSLPKLPPLGWNSAIQGAGARFIDLWFPRDQLSVWKKQGLAYCGRQKNDLPKTSILESPELCEYVSCLATGTLAGVIKLRILRWGEYSRLPACMAPNMIAMVLIEGRQDVEVKWEKRKCDHKTSCWGDVFWRKKKALRQGMQLTSGS